MILQDLIEAVAGREKIPAHIRRTVQPLAAVSKGSNRQRDNVRGRVGIMERNAVRGIGDALDALALVQAGVEIDNALVDIVEVAVDLRRAIGRASASTPCPGGDVNDRHSGASSFLMT